MTAISKVRVGDLRTDKLLQDAATEITSLWNPLASPVEAVVALGKRLAELKTSLIHGQWGRMFCDHDDAIENAVPFTKRSANLLIAVGAHSVLSNGKHASRFPSSWYTLSVLARIDETGVQRAIENGTIHPAMQRKDALALLPTKTRTNHTTRTTYNKWCDNVFAAMKDAGVDDQQYFLARLVALAADAKAYLQNQGVVL